MGILATALKLLGIEVTRWAKVHWPHPSASRPLPLPPIVFQAYAVHLAQFFTPVIRGLLSRNIPVGLQILYHPQFGREQQRQLRAFAAREWGLPAAAITCFEESTKDPIRLLVCADVYARFPRNVRTTCFIPHGSGLTGRHFKRHPLRKKISQFHKILVHGHSDHQLIKRYAPTTRPGFEVLEAGCPFFDDLVKPSQDRTAYLRRMGLNPDQATVLIAPSWRGLTQMANRGANYLADILPELAGRPLNVLVKLHACSYNQQMSAGIDWQNLLQRSARQHSFAVDDQIDDRLALAHADILITDISSRGVVFSALAKPVILWFPGWLKNDPCDQERFAHLKKISLFAHQPSDISRFIDELAADGFKLPASLAFVDSGISRLGESTDYVIEQMIRWVDTDTPDPQCGSGCCAPV